MRSKWAVPLILAISLSTITLAEAASTSKAGSVCKKAGLRQSSKGIDYICKKSGKKLIWAALPIKPTVKPEETPNASPSSKASPTPSPSPTESQSTSTIWDWTGSSWVANGPAPACVLPIIPNGALLDFTKVLSLIQPGQVRGGSYKPHGGLRWSAYGTYTPDVKISVPFHGYVVQAWQYLVGGIYQFGVNIENPCGMMVRIGHMHIASPEFSKILSALPTAVENDSREYQINPPAEVELGDVIATSVGMPAPAPADSLGAYIDLGILDLRQVNPVLGSNYSTNAEPKYSKYSVCWYQGNYLSPADQKIAASLPLANGDPKSDYCSSY